MKNGADLVVLRLQHLHIENRPGSLFHYKERSGEEGPVIALFHYLRVHIKQIHGQLVYASGTGFHRLDLIHASKTGQGVFPSAGRNGGRYRPPVSSLFIPASPEEFSPFKTHLHRSVSGVLHRFFHTAERLCQNLHFLSIQRPGRVGLPPGEKAGPFSPSPEGQAQLLYHIPLLLRHILPIAELKGQTALFSESKGGQSLPSGALCQVKILQSVVSYIYRHAAIVNSPARYAHKQRFLFPALLNDN